MNLRNLALIPVLSLIISISATLFLDLSDKLAFNPPYLLLTLNLIFWTTATLAIAFISAKSFIKEDSSIVLIISCSIIIFALPVIISGWVQTFSVNKSIALSNPCILVASILQVIGSILAFQGKQETKTSNRKRLLATAYLASVILVLANLTMALLGYYPTFFAATGPTLLRQVVLGSAVFFFAVAAIVFGVQYLRAKSRSLYWYALAIGLFSVGLFSSFETKAIGDVPTWLGRITLYVGTLYLTAAILSSNRKAGGTDRANAWASTFKANPEQFEALFSNLLDAFIYGKIVVDTEGKPVDWIFLDVNDSYGQVAGLKKDQIIGKRVSELYPEEHNDPVDWIGKYGHVALTGEPLHFEGYRQSLKKWLHVSSYSPKKGYFIAIFDDVTERKKAEEATNQSEEKYRQLFSSMTEMFQVIELIYDKDGKAFDYYYRNVNPAFEKLVGKTRDQLVDKRAKDVFGIVEDYWIAVYDEVAKTGNSAHFENYGAELDKWYEIYAWKTNDKQVAIIFTDVTERKKAEEGLQQQKAAVQQERDRLSSLLNSITDEVWFANTEKKFTLANPSAVKEFKLDSSTQGVDVESLAESLDVLRPDGSPRPVEEAPPLRALKGEVIKNQEEIIRTPAGGELKTRQVSSAPVKDNKGNIIGSVSVVRDVTELKQLQNRLQKYTEDLEKLVEERTKQLKDSERLAAIGATAGMVGHDIRNPLQAITSDVYLAKTELAYIPESEEKKNALESLTEIEKNIDYINKIVADLQDYARPLKPIVKETDIENLCQEVILKNDIPKNIKTSCKVENAAKEVMADPDLLKRVISNLVLNAIQAMPKGGRLTIHAYHKEGDITIEVKDTGVGIPEDVKTKLFTPMFTTKSKGQGFGLAVVKRVTESMNGTVTFESEKGKGTTFIVHLPPQGAKL